MICAVAAVGFLSYPGPAVGEDAPSPQVEVFKSPTCGCCAKWADHLEASGFRVRTTDVADLQEVKRRHGVPPHSESCHTAIVDGYVVEGHVPASDIARLLRERPEVRGLVAPGMPRGSPGMESPTPEPYVVYTFDEAGHRAVFSRHE
ncbi:MAG: DUF411 domain-containing protein [Myxococcota bacterium]